MKEKDQCFMERNRHLQFSEISDVSMDDIRQKSEASQIGMQSLKRPAMLVTVKELVGLV
jgi:hypothetical protein